MTKERTTKLTFVKTLPCGCTMETRPDGSVHYSRENTMECGVEELNQVTKSVLECGCTETRGPGYWSISTPINLDMHREIAERQADMERRARQRGEFKPRSTRRLLDQLKEAIDSLRPPMDDGKAASMDDEEREASKWG